MSWASDDNLRPIYAVRCAVCREITDTGHGGKQHAIWWLREKGWRHLTRNWPYWGRKTRWVCPACLANHPDTPEGRLL